MRANPDNHYHYEGVIIHAHPIAAANKFVRSVPHKRPIGLNAEVGFVTLASKRVIRDWLN
jgi:hypothetical protein